MKCFLTRFSDQLVSQNLKVGFELIQVRNGLALGKPTARGITPTGKLEDLEAELAETWVKTRGDEGEAVRVRMVGVGEVVKESWKNGESRKAMEAFIKFF